MRWSVGCFFLYCKSRWETKKKKMLLVRIDVMTYERMDVQTYERIDVRMY